jgi:hypothetical protein
MKKTFLQYPFLGLTFILFALSCDKAAPDLQYGTTDPGTFQRTFKVPSKPKPASPNPDTTAPATPAPPVVPYPQTPVSGCSYSPSYGDSIIFPQPVTGQDYILSPVNNPGPGKYFAWPVGLALDSTTGAIDLTKSQTGQRYDIGFVKSGTKDTCLNQLIVGGADYMDSVYIFDNGATKAVPYYDANPYMPPVCNGQGQGSGCTFDVTGSAAAQKVIVNKSSGEIDLQQTLNGSGLLGGAFGILPLNGQTITTTIYYRLNDQSNNALQHLDVQIMYFYNRASMTPGLLNDVATKLGNILSGKLVSTLNPRPPLIIIVRHN